MERHLVSDPRITVINGEQYGPGHVYGRTKPGHCGHDAKIYECVLCWPEEPKVQERRDNLSDTVETHPAYAHIGASRVSGSSNLYQSEFRHQHYMIVRIHRSELHRGLSNDRPHEGEGYIEVAMSEAQWATFISSPNGGGSPCTLTRRNGKLISPIPKRAKRSALFSKEMRDKLADALAALNEAHSKVAAGKATKETLRLIEQARMQITNSTTFVADQFDEHMEKTVEAAKVEVEAHMQAAVQRAGLEALGGKPPIALQE